MTWKLKLLFEWGGGALWADDDAARDTALDWDYPPDPSPWPPEEFAKFEAATLKCSTGSAASSATTTRCAISHSENDWLGSYYELSLQLSRVPDDHRLRLALDALWSAPEIVARDPGELEVPPPGDLRSHRGTIRTPLGDVPCVSWIIRELNGGSDWLDLCLPTGALDKRGLTYPVHESPPEILDAIDRTLVAVGRRVFAAAQFLVGLIGEEVSGMTENELAGNVLLPDENGVLHWKRRR